VTAVTMNHDAKIIAGGRCRVNALQTDEGQDIIFKFNKNFLV